MRKVIFRLLFCFVSVGVYASDIVFELTASKDIPLLSAGTVLCTTGIMADNYFSFPGRDKTKRDISSVNAFDSFFAHSYSKPLDMAASILTYTFSVAPVALAFIPDADWKTVCVMYAETVLFSQGVKEALKSVVRRYRPYTYYDNQESVSLYVPGDYIKSWPSGHTVTIFAAAVFASYVYSEYNPDSEVPFTLFCLTVASGVGSLRVLSGNHFVTDVLSGALIGSACGFFVPFVHKINRHMPGKKGRDGSPAIQMMLYPCGAGLHLEF